MDGWMCALHCIHENSDVSYDTLRQYYVNTIENYKTNNYNKYIEHHLRNLFNKNEIKRLESVKYFSNMYKFEKSHVVNNFEFKGISVK